MAAPVTRQVSGCAGRVPSPTGSDTERGQPLAAAVAELPVLDASGRRVTFGALFRERRAVVVFVRVSTGREGGEGPLVGPRRVQLLAWNRAPGPSGTWLLPC